MSFSAAQRILPALDMPWAEAPRFMETMLSLGIDEFKVGLINIHRVGTPGVVRVVHACGGKCFLDAKLPDTPDTVKGAASAIVEHGVSMFNLHASCGIRSMRAAVSVRGDAKVLAVSVLTSMKEEEAYLTFGAPVKAKVLQFAREAVLAGVQGMICSPLELELFADYEELAGLELYPPGIRSKWAVKGQQERFTSPAAAIVYPRVRKVILGGPLYNPPPEIGSPLEAGKRVIGEIEEALQTQEAQRRG